LRTFFSAKYVSDCVLKHT